VRRWEELRNNLDEKAPEQEQDRGNEWYSTRSTRLRFDLSRPRSGRFSLGLNDNEGLNFHNDIRAPHSQRFPTSFNGVFGALLQNRPPFSHQGSWPYS
jgi:hypothetical protein